MFDSAKRRKQKLIADFGKIKTEWFNLPRIARFFLLSDKDDAHQTISDRTWPDLDMDEIFMFCDRTSSKIGQLSGEGIYHPMIPGFVANSLENNKRSILLTGSNMSGKTTFIRTLGINILLSQTIGLAFARAFTLSRLRVHSAISILDNLFDDKSYYFEEVLTIKEMLVESKAESGNLFLLDELFRGTNTLERIAAGKAVLEYLNGDDNLVVVSTHDLELADYLQDSFGLYHFAETIENDQITFDYKLKPGNLETTNAIRILGINDYPNGVVTEALRLSEEIKQQKKGLHNS